MNKLTFTEEIQNAIGCLEYWERRTGEYVSELNETSLDEDECVMEDTQKSLEFLRDVENDTKENRKLYMKKVYLCPWCVQGIGSHGYTIYSGSYVQDHKCEQCNEEEEIMECVIENQEFDV